MTLTLTDAEIESAGLTVMEVEEEEAADTDGTDGDSDGTDGDTDGTDGDTDGTDGSDTDGTDSDADAEDPS